MLRSVAHAQVLDVFAVFEENGIRPRALYVELFHAVIRLSRSMYAEELSLTLQALARYGIGNPTVLAHVVPAAAPKGMVGETVAAQGSYVMYLIGGQSS